MPVKFLVGADIWLVNDINKIITLSYKLCFTKIRQLRIIFKVTLIINAIKNFAVASRFTISLEKTS